MIHLRRMRLSCPGFTLMELSVTLVIVGLVAAASWTAGSQVLDSIRKVQTNNKLNVIESTLMQFRIVNNRLPCPTDATLVTTMGNYGVEAANPGSCTGGAPSANQADANNGVAEGAVPFKALGLPAEFMYDGWGRKFDYAVNVSITSTLSMLGQSMNDQGKITVNDASGNKRDSLVYSTTGGTYYTPASGLYALVSFGSDGHGGYLKSGSRYSAGSSDADEQTNCHCNSSAVEGTYAATYVQKDMTATFGDIVRYKDRWQLTTPDDSNAPNLGMVATLGTRIDGVSAWGGSGYFVATGDVNGDGIPDLIIDDPQTNKGYIYVVFGTKFGFPNPLPLSSLNGSNGFRLDGVNAFDNGLGMSLATGDINGDGIPDLIIGDFRGAAGSTYVVFGHSGAWPASQTLASGPGNLIDGTQGFRLDGAGASDFSGFSVALGDVNGDGIPDLIIGAYGTNGLAGSTYVVFGGTGPKGDVGKTWSNSTFASSQGVFVLNLTGTGTGFINGTNGFRLDGVTAGIGGDYVGLRVAAGDINGDGKADIIIGTWFANSVGSIYVVFGGPTRKGGTPWPAAGNLVLNTGGANVINGTDGFRLDGTALMGLGHSVASGDVNGDGIPDLIIGAYAANSNAGYTYVVFGGTGPKGDVGKTWANSTFASSPGLFVLNLTGTGTGFINGTNGFRVDGVSGNDYSGYAVAAGDINNDGKADIVIGAENASYSAGQAGSTYVVFGGTTRMGGTAWPAAGNLVLNTGGANVINGTDGFRLDGVSGSDYSGYAVAVGDVNGDGTPDLIIGAYGASYSAGSAGSTYVAYGRPANTTWPATSLLSTLK